MEGYLSGLLRPPPVPGGHPGGHPGPPALGQVGPPPPQAGPRPIMHPGMSGYSLPGSGPGLSLPPGLGLPPGHPYNALYADSLMAAQQQQHAEMYAREAHRAAELQKGLDMHRLVESQRIESLRQAEARANSFLNPYTKDPLSSLLPSAHPYSDPLREREIRERNALVQSAFSMGSLYPPNPLLPPSDHYPSSFGGPMGLPPPPVSSPHTLGPLYSPNIAPRPELSPSSLTSPIQRHRDPSPKVTTSTFSPHSRGSSPFLSPAPPSANNSSLAEKLKVGFGDRSPTITPAKPQDFSPTRLSGLSREPSREHSISSQDQSARRLTKSEEGSILHETYIRSSGPLTNTQASSASTLVTSSSHSGLNFPGSHSSSLSKVSASPWNPAEPAPTSAASQKHQDDTSEIQIIEEEEEEVLVDDFDGQCCRTYPYNHSKIQRWREEKNKKDKEKRKKEEEHKKEQEQKESAKHLANVQSVKIPTSNPEKSLNSTKQNETLTTSAGSIPVGIVSARQRLDQEKVAHRSVPGELINRDLGSMPLPPSGPLVSGIGLPASSAHGMGPSTWSSGPPPPWPMSGQPGPPGPSPYPSPYGAPPGHPMTAGPVGQMGPIPMGYQLAKDPMTGQILLIPTDHAQRPPSMMAGFDPPFGMPPGMQSGMPPTSSASQHLHHLMLQQQHLQYMQHQDILQQQMRMSSSAAHPHKPRVPETITVSDDDDDDCGKAKDSRASSEVESTSVVTSASTPPFVTKEPSPTPIQIKREIVKTEFKTEVEVADCEPYAIGTVEDLKNVCDDSLKYVASSAEGSVSMDENVTIKQERPSLSCEEPLMFSDASVSNSNGCEISAPFLSDIEKSVDLKEETPVLKKEIKSEPGTGTFCEDTKLCAETLLFMSECSTPSTCNEIFADVEEPQTDGGNEPSGFDILFQGIELLAGGTVAPSELSPIQTLTALAGLDLLCSVTRNDTFEYGLSKNILDDSRLDLGLLCAITAEDYHEQLNWVDPIIKLKGRINVKKYWTQESEKEAKDYISAKIKQFTKDHPENVEEAKYDNIKALAKMVKKIKNMEIMSQLEVDLRLKITELQNNYREKQKTLSKLKTPRKKNMKNKKGKQRGPGRPKKKKFPNPKSKMGRPRKHPKVPVRVEFEGLDINPDENKVKLEEDDIEQESFADSDAPPVLEPQQQVDVDDENGYDSSRNRGSLLKPPRLTASSPPPQHSNKDSQLGSSSNNSDARNTTLSTLTSKFMKGKANPFANLLSKLAGGPSSGTSETQRNAEGGSVSENASVEAERSSSEKSSDDSSSETGSMMSPTRDCSFQFGKTSKLGYGLEAYRHSKKRKADKPKKHSGGSSETIVPKKPKNLFMMMDFQRGFNAKSAEDEYNFDENEEEDLNPGKSYEYREPRKPSPTPSIKSHESHYQEWTDDDVHSSPKRKHKKSKSSKSKSSKKDRSPSCQGNLKEDEKFESLRSAQLKAADLKDGLRMLMLQDGKFWPARLNSTKLPDVYGVVMDRQRGNRPIILPRDDILKEAVLEIRPKSVHQLPMGTRVCAVWSSAYICLFPGTITHPDEPLPEGHVLVELDDGDSRLVELSKIRMLPADYSRVVYDPDPIASLRKRRVSTDSHDSGASHGEHRTHEIVKKSSKLVDNSFPSEKKKSKSGDGKIKKKHKKCHKHGHHHCHKHKHKRHKSGESSSKKSFEQKFAIRSPPHGSHYVKSDHDNESSEASQEESDQQNSSDEESTAIPHRTTHHDLAPNKGRELWQWSGEGYKRPGGKGKSKKLFFKSIQRGKDLLHVNDCAVFLSTGRSDRPYIGKIEMLWETGNGSMMVKVKWFYHPEEIETCGRKFDLKLPGGLFQSPHTDENSVHTISHKCEVSPIKEYTRFLQTDSKRKSSMYYLAGSYDPAGLTVHFQPGVLKSTDSD